MSKWKTVIFGLFKCGLPFSANHGEVHDLFKFAQEYTEMENRVMKNYSLADLFVAEENFMGSESVLVWSAIASAVESLRRGWTGE